MKTKQSKVSWAESLALTDDASQEEVLALATPLSALKQLNKQDAQMENGTSQRSGSVHARRSSLTALQLDAHLGTPWERLDSATALAAYLARSYGKVRTPQVVGGIINQY